MKRKGKTEARVEAEKLEGVRGQTGLGGAWARGGFWARGGQDRTFSAWASSRAALPGLRTMPGAEQGSFSQS